MNLSFIKLKIATTVRDRNKFLLKHWPTLFLSNPEKTSWNITVKPSQCLSTFALSILGLTYKLDTVIQSLADVARSAIPAF